MQIRGVEVTRNFERHYRKLPLRLRAVAKEKEALDRVKEITHRIDELSGEAERAERAGELERVADVICHEVAHMWFGDLVTMKWWNGIWLNEAFATFMEVLAVDAYRPEWQRWVSFGVEREAAMAVDGLHTTRPVEFPVGRPEEAQGMFDEALRDYPGSAAAAEAVFFLGVSRYKMTHDPKPLREAYETLTAKFPGSEWTKRAAPYRLIPQ